MASAQSAALTEVTVENLLGGSCNRSWATLRVTVKNHNSSPVRGELAASGDGLGGPELSRALEVPARGETSLQIQAPPSWCNLSLCFDVGEGQRRCAGNVASWSDDQGSRDGGLLLVQSDLELRPALSILNPEPHQEASNRGDPRPELAITLARRRGASLELPELAVGYHHLRFVVIKADQLSTLTEGQRRALSRWVRTGGQLVLVTTGAQELLGLPVIGELLPGLRAGRGPTRVVFSPDLTRLYQLSDDSPESGQGAAAPLRFEAPGLVEAPYGSRARSGLGEVHVMVVTPRADLDASDSSYHAAQSALDRLFESRSAYPMTIWRDAPLELASRGQLDPGYSGNVLKEREAASDYHLDLNQEERLPLAIYVLIVLLATAAIFIVQRRWSRGGRRVLALFGPTAAIALAGCLSIFALSYASRGAGNRYRSMAWIEIASGQQEGAMWRRLALAIDAPGLHRLPRERSLLITAPNSRVHATGADGAEVLEVTGSRWETVITAEQGVVDLGGAVELEWTTDNRPRAVRNGLPRAIDDARVSFRHDTWSLGRLDPGERIELDALDSSVLYSLPGFWPNSVFEAANGETAEVASVTGTLELDCPRRGDFRGDRCHTQLLVWGAP